MLADIRWFSCLFFAPLNHRSSQRSLNQLITNYLHAHSSIYPEKADFLQIFSKFLVSKNSAPTGLPKLRAPSAAIHVLFTTPKTAGFQGFRPSGGGTETTGETVR